MKMNINTSAARILEDVQIKLSALWIALMFVWQQGDVLRLYAGDVLVGEDIGGELISPELMWLNMDDDSGCYDSPLTDVEVSSESLGKHHRRHFLCCSQSPWLGDISLGL
jgi:hypothetical protein